MQGLEDEGVDVSRVVVSDATPSAFTYVIVDKGGGTRTCLHTPQTEGVWMVGGSWLVWLSCSLVCGPRALAWRLACRVFS